ncbi:RAD protein [Plasmodium gonderi]|uniref:RAD protein n=1 Tax=Plasmodium gonderi TaxID=77519 RepID=A0A1Y1JDF4_PLAGO|nr:RAD protein [Plasmodium gonderi]GAW79718.1 RAD protein [Plasmodium gonderi]
MVALSRISVALLISLLSNPLCPSDGSRSSTGEPRRGGRNLTEWIFMDASEKPLNCYDNKHKFNYEYKHKPENINVREYRKKQVYENTMNYNLANAYRRNNMGYGNVCTNECGKMQAYEHNYKNVHNENNMQIEQYKKERVNSPLDEYDSLTCRENRKFLSKFMVNNRLPFGCTFWEVSQVLTDKQILKRITYIALDISLKKAFIGYYYLVVYLTRRYYNMINKMSMWFINVAISRNIPKHVRGIYWQEARKKLLQDLDIIEDMSKLYFQSLIHGNRRIWIVNYELFLERCRKLWKRAISSNRLKWSQNLSMWIIQYNQSNALGRGRAIRENEQGAMRRKELDQRMHNRGVHNREIYNQEIYNQGVYNQGVYNQGVHNQGVHNQGVHNQGMHNQGMHNQEVYNEEVYNQRMHNQTAQQHEREENKEDVDLIQW